MADVIASSFFFNPGPAQFLKCFLVLPDQVERSLQKQNNTQVLRRTTYEYKRNSNRNCFASFCCLFSPFSFPIFLDFTWTEHGWQRGLYCVALTIDLGSSCCRCAPLVMLSQKELYKALGVHGLEFHLNFSKFPPFFWAAVPDRICLTLPPPPTKLKSISKWVHKERKNLKFTSEKLYSPERV